MSASEHADELFYRAAVSNDALGYPWGTEFVSQDMEGWEAVTRRNLLEGLPTVLVDEAATEILFEPHARRGPLGWLDRARGRPHVRIRWRQGAHAYGVEMALGRDTLERFHGPAHLDEPGIRAGG